MQQRAEFLANDFFDFVSLDGHLCALDLQGGGVNHNAFLERNIDLEDMRGFVVLEASLSWRAALGVADAEFKGRRGEVLEPVGARVNGGGKMCQMAA